MSASSLHHSAVVIDACAPILRDGDNAALWIEGGATCALATVALHYDSRATTLDLIGTLYRQIHRNGDLVLARTADDIQSAKQTGRFAIVLAFQSSAALDQRLDMVEIYYRLGVRSMNLAYNRAEAPADGCMEPRNGGLTNFGRQLVVELNRTGMLLDLSHTGRRASLEAMELSSAPVAFTHSNAAALYEHPRNITDEQIRRCAETGGVIGINGHPAFIRAGTASPTCEDYLAHVDHMVAAAGIDHVGLGLDFSFLPGEQIPQARYARMMAEKVFSPDTLPPPPWTYPWGDARNLGQLTEALLRRGWSDDDVLKILGGNFLRLFQAVWRSDD